MQFHVKDQEYFLEFAEDERRWYIFVPTATGINRIPVYVDAAKKEWADIHETGNRRIQ